tara:strand:+ start:2361 stop:2498 length:138 start_codon:yes stop_codon:yes gene_type:complete
MTDVPKTGCNTGLKWLWEPVLQVKIGGKGYLPRFSPVFARISVAF